MPQMDQPPEADELSPATLLEFYKVLSDPTRLRLAGLLAAGPASVVDLSRATSQPAANIARHLARLVAVGVAVESGGGRYTLDDEGMRRRNRKRLESPRTRALAGATDERSRALATFLRDGRLISFPTGDQRKLIILGEIAGRFDPQRTYSEREVNEVLKQVYDDYATIRRALVDYHFMNRHKGAYWLGEGRRQGETGAASTALAASVAASRAVCDSPAQRGGTQP